MPSEVPCGVAPFGNRVCFIVPMRKEGNYKQTGIWLSHHAGVPVVYGRVIAAHPTCRNVRIGDWVVHLPKRPVRLKTAAGNIYAIDETNLIAIVEAGDGKPWFLEEGADASVVHSGG